VPAFDHIVVIIFENKDYRHVIGASSMPNLNRLAGENTLLSAYYAPAHPSLPNYLALIGGDTFGVNRNCEDCFQDAPNLADLIEESGREWKTYQESMPSACFHGSKDGYAQKHNPFMYFDNIRLDEARCEQRVVPLTQLDTDLAADQLPDFLFITPNLCNSGHDCGRDTMDAWLGQMVDKLRESPAWSQNSLIVITFDEASGDDSSGCCGLPEEAGGRIATVLVSPLARPGFTDDTPYTHYSLLKTIAEAWGLPELGHSADPQTALIETPWN
jgi:acid phosphatase